MTGLPEDIYFSGNTALQCENGTYPECRQTLVGHLRQAVELGELVKQEADLRLKKADALWSDMKKTPNVAARLELKKKYFDDREGQIKAANQRRLDELKAERDVYFGGEEKEAVKPRKK